MHHTSKPSLIWDQLLYLQIIPGTVSLQCATAGDNQFLLIVDGPELGLCMDSVDPRQTKGMGFHVLVLPFNCTHLLQPCGLIFGTVAAQYSKLYAAYCWTPAGQVGQVKLCRPTSLA
jgi:hypothetical protein